MNKSERKALAGRIASARAQTGLTLREVAKKSQTVASTVLRWETGATMPRVSDVYALAKALGCSRSWIVDGSGVGPVQQGAGQ